MPARVIDGEGLWRSKKLKQVSAKYRAEYANLLPLAEANGVFDCDPERVWSDVYAFNRPEITVDMIEEILDQFEAVDLLRRWSERGKQWGYWTGINKSGRLPSETHIKRYKNLPPNPPPSLFSVQDLSGIIRDNPGESGIMPEGFGIGIGLDRNGIGSGMEREAQNDETQVFEDNNGQGEEVKSEKLIAIHCQTILRTNADLSDSNKFILKTLDTVHKGSVVARAFEVWAKEHKYDEIRRPVTAFLKEADDLLSTEGSTIQPEVENPVVKAAGREIAYRTGNQVALNPKAKSIINSAVEEENYTTGEIVEAFMAFFQTVVPDKIPYAGINFANESADRLYAVRRKAAEKAQEQAAIASAAERIANEAQRERDERLAALQKEQEEMEEDLPE